MSVEFLFTAAEDAEQGEFAPVRICTKQSREANETRAKLTTPAKEVKSKEPLTRETKEVKSNKVNIKKFSARAQKLNEPRVKSIKVRKRRAAKRYQRDEVKSNKVNKRKKFSARAQKFNEPSKWGRRSCEWG